VVAGSSVQAGVAHYSKVATDLPAALLAKMLGMHFSVAVAWQRASSGDRMAYAADIGRRTSDRQSTR
jgi:hypothetical protein